MFVGETAGSASKVVSHVLKKLLRELIAVDMK
jgi:hypothetical protein